MNDMTKKNKKMNLKNQILFGFAVCLSLTTACFSQDLSNNTDLQESRLSLSLTPTAIMTVNEQQQQVMISQYGILNNATIKQLASTSNNIIISQDGIGNQAFIEQYGNGNSVNIQQSGYNNHAGVIQEGDANIANINQAGEQTFIVHQIGNDMVVNITQY
jgi:minor curlin subunit